MSKGLTPRVLTQRFWEKFTVLNPLFLGFKNTVRRKFSKSFMIRYLKFKIFSTVDGKVYGVELCYCVMV